MRFDLRQPCNECPFRTDIEFHLSSRKAEEIAASLFSDQSFACHKTTIFTEDDQGFSTVEHGPKTQACAGATIMLEHMERPNQLMRICERIGYYDRTKMDMESASCHTATEFVSMHRKRERGNKQK